MIQIFQDDAMPEGLVEGGQVEWGAVKTFGGIWLFEKKTKGEGRIAVYNSKIYNVLCCIYIYVYIYTYI